jgi:hypothetical protein
LVVRSLRETKGGIAMDTVFSTLTIYFEDPFWMGIYERGDGDRVSVCKITFGKEPKDYEVYAFLLENWQRMRFSPAVDASKRVKTRINPKRMQRAVSNQIRKAGAGTKAQEALKLQQEQGKLEHKVRSKEQKQEEQEQQFLLKQQKRKEKHKGH